MKMMTFVLGAAMLTGCANNPTRLAKPVEAHGKVFGSLSDSAGAQMENYTKSTRLSLLRYASIPKHYDPNTDGSEVKDAFNDFHSAVTGWKVKKKSQPTAITPEDESRIVSIFLVCNPLNASAVFQEQQKAMGTFGKALGKLTGKPPASLAGLISSLQKDYTLKYKTPEDGGFKYPTEVCKSVVGDALDGQPSELDELLERNFHAIDQGKIGGTSALTGLGEVFAVVSAIQGFVVKGLTLAEQEKRYAAIKEFFADPENTNGLVSATQRLDLAVHIALQGSRVSAKEDFRSSWQKYKYTMSKPSGGDVLSKQHAAAEQLLTSLQKLDAIIKSETAMKGEVNDLGCVNLAKPKAAQVFKPCFRTGFGKAMNSSLTQMKAVVTNDWDRMSPDDKVAYWDSVYASLSAMNDLNTELQKFANDKENFVKLNNILDDLFR